MREWNQTVRVSISVLVVLGLVILVISVVLKKEKSFLTLPEKIIKETEEVHLTPEQEQEIKTKISEIEAEIEKNPEALDEYWSLAIQKRRLGNLRDVAEVYIRAIEINPAFYLGYANLGTMYMFMGEYALSEEALKEAIVRNPKQTVPYLKLGELYQYYVPGKKGELEALYLGALEKILGENNKTPIVQALAEMYYENKNWKKSREYYRLLIEKYGGDKELVQEILNELDQKIQNTNDKKE